MKDKINKIIIGNSCSIIDALKIMDERKIKLLAIVDENNRYQNLLSIGDIQRAIIKGFDVTQNVEEVVIDEKIVASTDDSKEKIVEMMRSMRCDFMPIIDESKELYDVIFWEELFEDLPAELNDKRNIPVVVMAGGKGTRLKPISNILPKPLIPVGEKTILEEIINRFESAGSEDFYLSVNYKKEMIKYYLDSINKQVEYFSEDKPLGTAGSLSILKGKLKSTFYVTNCDILIDQDLNEIYKYHEENKNDITLVAALKNLSIPYGTISTGKGGLLLEMQEKPNLSFKINTGVYILEPHILNEIPDNTFLHITDLIEKIRVAGGRVGVFPISEKSWMDIGEWPEYMKTVSILSGDNSFKGLKYD
ncbi:nucleotidyltransferase family protein [Vibrio mediterranei]|uniref:nucleotidyltransferase family protein n=1 Tax=Vibrio mediterranei TaxID=689 RepID=UPI002284681F|nr:nucleotidyltransferase family protein [Vibrio mediterranei]MCY9853644.1 nucleotidyltransferase family protein [Vibrio mediterranei]